MGTIKTFLVAERKNSLPLEVSKRVEELYWDGLNFNAALRKAKEEYSKKQDWTPEEILQREG